MNHKNNNRSSFSGKIGFVLSAAGASVGLGNIWRFPYLAAKYGGGIFLLIYIILALTFGYSMIVAETSLGRMTGKSPVGAFHTFGKSKWLSFGGWINAIIPILIVPYYSVIGGWVIKYLVEYAKGHGHDLAADGYFSTFISNGVSTELCFIVFTLCTLGIIYAGVRNGIERVSRIMMPILVVLSVVITVYSVTRPGALSGVKYFLIPNPANFSWMTVVAAMGQMFYSLSIAMGILITFGSYMKKDVSIEGSTKNVEIFDTAIAIMAGLMIIPAVFAFSGGDPDTLQAGPSLMFITLPKVFDSMGMGTFVGIMFFVLVLFAAMTSSIALTESAVSTFEDELGWGRKKSTVIMGVIMLALVNNQPKVMNLMEILKHYLAHQEEVVTRRTQYDLNKARERAHILEGLLKALDNIDEVIRIIRGSENTQVAKARLMERFELSDAQAQAIVDMRLRTLTGLEREKLEAEYKELMARIRRLEAILADRNLLLRVIREEILAISEKYGDERKTAIGFDEFDISMEDMIPNENTVITMTKLGYIKRMTVDNFRSQNRGGKGIKGMQTIEDDYIDELLMTTTHHYLMFFTNMGKVYRLKAYEIPEAGRTARGTAIINLLQLQAGEKITAVLSLKDYSQGQYLFMATKSGIVKKTPIQDYANVRKTGLAAISLKDDDELIEVKFTDNKKDIILVTKYGQCIRFKDTDVRSTGRVSMGVRGINLSDGDEIIGMQLCSQGDYLLIVSEKGMGKRTSMSEFSVQNRGGKGVKCYKITEKTGNVVGVKAVNDDNEVMMITTEGIIIRIACSDISILGRITSGVKLMNLDEKVSVASIAKVREKEENTEVNEQEDTESEE